MTQLDLINFKTPIFFSFEFLILCIFFVLNYGLFGLISSKKSFLKKLKNSYLQTYKVVFVWQTSNKV